jgi:hypothetical protein
MTPAYVAASQTRRRVLVVGGIARLAQYYQDSTGTAQVAVVNEDSLLLGARLRSSDAVVVVPANLSHAAAERTRKYSRSHGLPVVLARSPGVGEVRRAIGRATQLARPMPSFHARHPSHGWHIPRSDTGKCRRGARRPSVQTRYGELAIQVGKANSHTLVRPSGPSTYRGGGRGRCPADGAASKQPCAPSSRTPHATWSVTFRPAIGIHAARLRAHRLRAVPRALVASLAKARAARVLRAAGVRRTSAGPSLARRPLETIAGATPRS